MSVFVVFYDGRGENRRMIGVLGSKKEAIRLCAGVSATGEGPAHWEEYKVLDIAEDVLEPYVDGYHWSGFDAQYALEEMPAE